MLEVEKKANFKGEGAGAKPLIVVGIPALNEENTIAKVVLRARKCADWVVVCDDGSVDMTAEIAESVGAEVVRHERNLGYGAAIRSLFNRARIIGADVLVTLDGDGQHDPSEIPRVVKPIIEGSADFVVGSRFLNDMSANAIPWYRRAGIRVITKLTNGQSRSSAKDAQSGFRAYGRRCIEHLEMSEQGMGVSSEILMNAGKQHLKIWEVPINCKYRNGLKTSTHNSVRHGLGVLGSIIKFVVEDKPLIMLGVPGILSMAAGVVFGVWMLQLYATNHQIETNVALASLTFFITGLVFVFTALMLYAISRVVQKVNSKQLLTL